MSATPFIPYDMKTVEKFFHLRQASHLTKCKRVNVLSWYGYFEISVLERLQMGNNCCMDRRICV